MLLAVSGAPAAERRVDRAARQSQRLPQSGFLHFGFALHSRIHGHFFKWDRYLCIGGWQKKDTFVW